MDRKKTYYGVSVGILMVHSYFRRYMGDIGHAGTWNFPVQYKVVTGAVPSMMTDLHNSSLLEPFKKAADELIEAGVDGITTTCGFLSIYQRELADYCSVPVATSSLLQVPMVERMLPTGKKVGILTYNGEVLNGPYLEAVGVDPATPVGGMPQTSNFVRWIREGDNSVTFETLRGEVVATAEKFHAENPDVGAIVLECTNLAPFTADIADRLGIPVYDTVSMVNLFHAGLRPRRYVQD
ncbi:aspartate/glutamate racemase family protein [Afifella sp. H1R]|uniref:aspartate/glutamate racemase family protein n=1 Tax=unclassified Afifella TaxID=2624128 RepID=UPI001F195357|nr:aspartate/glutamate racemase family protein [Afifella sp. H1R]MCF1505499.1 aspartate/glutamate racemase family protein [Afifella sp. H1R]